MKVAPIRNVYDQEKKGASPTMLTRSPMCGGAAPVVAHCVRRVGNWACDHQIAERLTAYCEISLWETAGHQVAHYDNLVLVSVAGVLQAIARPHPCTAGGQ